MERYLLDTLYWLWLQKGDEHHVDSKKFKEVEEWQKRGSVYVSAISVWEISYLVAAGTIHLDRSVEHWVESGTEDGGFQLLPLSTRVLIESSRLPDNPHGDPGDRLLMATAREYDLTIITRDKKILTYATKGHVKARKL
ncbi:MAG: type II toxin-antitoxin system VapC family toxin [Acidobacteria bacterium]|nr:type II toxin-antitoxin system VapC family toxin [Acidobacteriota bacterium]